MTGDLQRAIDAIWRIESATLIAGLTRITRDVGLAEDLAHDALLAEARVDFAMPHGVERAGRLASVLEVIYLVFNEGYSATSGDDWMRPSVCEEAMRLGRILTAHAPDDADVHALLALMELHASRAAARTQHDGSPVLLLEQDRTRWDRLLIQRGLASLEHALRLGGALSPYALQAGIVACHARARTAAETDWVKIVALYDALAQVTPSPVVELNRAVAVSMAFGAAEALPLVEALADHQVLAKYHLLPSVRADLLQRVGRFDEAKHEFERAASMTQNARERALLRRRAADCATGG